MAEPLVGVFPWLEVWRVEGVADLLVRYVPGTTIPLVWQVPPDGAQALGYTRPHRTMTQDQYRATGPLWMGTTNELADIDTDPWERVERQFQTEAQVKPWLRDPEVMAIHLSAALENRQVTPSELQTTQWWRSHSDAEREWINLNASDPQRAGQLLSDNRAQIMELLSTSGVNNAPEVLVSTMMAKWTTGEWTETQMLNQVRKLADPYTPGVRLDDEIARYAEGLDTTRQGTDVVRDQVRAWLGPVGAKGWNDQMIQDWAGRIRNDPDAALALDEELRRQRMALFPTYSDPSLRYEDIAAPWRAVWNSEWGRMPDESDPMFMRIVNTNDLAENTKLLRSEGLNRNVGQVVNNFASSLGAAFGGQIRRAE